jgi:hypothetical protein
MITTLTNIERQQQKSGYAFVVTVSCISGGDQWGVKEMLSAAELATYAAFKKAMLRRAGLMYVDSTYEDRRGAQLWAGDIQHLLGAPVREGVT